MPDVCVRAAVEVAAPLPLSHSLTVRDLALIIDVGEGGRKEQSVYLHKGVPRGKTPPPSLPPSMVNGTFLIVERMLTNGKRLSSAPPGDNLD